MSARKIPTLPTKRGKMMLVSLDGERGAFKCEVRTLPGSAVLPGDIVWVEFGGFASQRKGTRHEGQWRPCMVQESKHDGNIALCVRVISSSGRNVRRKARKKAAT